MELSKLRESIDSIDSEIRKLLLERADLAREVANSKIESNNLTIYREDREREILSKLTEGVDAEVAIQIREIYRQIMRSSRTLQYKILIDKFDDVASAFKIESMADNEPKKVICQGIEGAYSHLAALQFSDAKVEFKPSFREVFSSISGQNYGIVPLDNSTKGQISEVYDLLLSGGLYIVKSIDLKVNHVAMAKHGAKMQDIRYITAHPQALAQCSKYIERMGLMEINSTNNAVAARSIAVGDRYDICCLGDRSNAERYGLDIIDSDVNNSRENTTRFIVVADKLIAPIEGGKVSVVFSMENGSGTLANVLDIIASYGVSLSKIESRPIADEKWEYMFYADIEGNIRDKNIRALIHELTAELPYLQVLGSYDELR